MLKKKEHTDRNPDADSHQNLTDIEIIDQNKH
jgi:hypothetical protein